MMRVDPLSAVPKYYQLSEILRHKIDNKEWRPHDPIPPERQLETLYHVSRTTVREALNHLADQGYIYREHGRGTFVSRPKLQHSLHLLHSFTDDMKARGVTAGHRILEFEWVSPAGHVRQQLELPPEIKRILRIERLRYGDSEPVGLQVAFLPLTADQALSREELDRSGSLYRLLEDKFSLIPVEADETLEATAAKPREASLLEVPECSPLLLLERTTYSQQHRPMEFSKMLYRADRYRYYIHITR